MNKIYKIEPPGTSKDGIKQPKLAEDGVIAKLGASILMIGNSGSGKTVLLQNLITRKEFYGDCFQKIFICCPSGDDILQGVDATLFDDLKEAVKAIDTIQEHQKKEIAKHGCDNAHQYALILDDVVGNTEFMKSAPFLKSFIASRHYCLTTFLCSQHLRRIPKICRLQASILYIFPCSAGECQTLCEEYCPPSMNSKQFMKLLDDTWSSQPFQFLTIHMKRPMAERYRRGLAQLINLDYYRSL